jgi:hypothetical protein
LDIRASGKVNRYLATFEEIKKTAIFRAEARSLIMSINAELLND